MDEHDFLTVLRGYWIDEWQELAPAPVEQRLWADDSEAAEPEEGTWTRASVRTEGGVRKGVGRAREETRGLIQIEVFSPVVDGTGPGERLASTIAGIWRAFRHSRIQLSAPSVVGLAPDGAFNRHLISLGWRGDMRLIAP